MSVELASGSFSFGLAGSSASSRGGLELLRIKSLFFILRLCEILVKRLRLLNIVFFWHVCMVGN